MVEFQWADACHTYPCFLEKFLEAGENTPVEFGAAGEAGLGDHEGERDVLEWTMVGLRQSQHSVSTRLL
ncbi:hypothetical protein GCM10025788_26470 [Serinicoccus chungangensis]